MDYAVRGWNVWRDDLRFINFDFSYKQNIKIVLLKLHSHWSFQLTAASLL